MSDTNQKPRFNVGDRVVFVGRSRHVAVVTNPPKFDGVLTVESCEPWFNNTTFNYKLSNDLFYYDDEIEHAPAEDDVEQARRGANPCVELAEIGVRDPVDPDHYKTDKIECIEAIRVATSGLDGAEAFITGNVIKYMWRWKKKNGTEDLKKAKKYIDMLIKLLEDDDNARS